MLKVGILGYGGIARSHRKGYEQIAELGAPVELVALCDIDPARFEQEIAINIEGDKKKDAKVYRTYTDLEDMLAGEQLDIIDICLPTYLHCEYACKLLRRGYHVQCEKPMGMNEEECKKMMTAAEESGKKLMIGMCLRFNALYEKLKELIESGEYGKVESIYMERLSPMPRWGFDGWYHDYNRSGGVIMDLQIHDVDMLRYLFGEPKAVSAVTNNARTRSTTVHSRFFYDDMPVTAIGDWGQSKTKKFKFYSRFNMEKATVEIGGNTIKIFPDEGEPIELEIEIMPNHMGAESWFFARTILGEIENTKNRPEDAMGTVRLVKKLVESADNGGKILEV